VRNFSSCWAVFFPSMIPISFAMLGCDGKPVSVRQKSTNAPAPYTVTYPEKEVTWEVRVSDAHVKLFSKAEFKYDRDEDLYERVLAYSRKMAKETGHPIEIYKRLDGRLQDDGK
jgi:hypothetical protein